MKQNENPKESFFVTEPIGKLIAKFAIPCVISLLVNALYNIVDQIFIGRGVGYLGNGATNVIFPITVIALAFALLIGDGGAAYLSLKLGQGDKKAATKGVGNALIMLSVVGVMMLVVGVIFIEKIALLFGATPMILPYAMDYGRIIVIGLPFVVVGTGLNGIIRADGSPQFAMLSMLLGALLNTILDPIFIFVFKMGVQGAAYATIIGQLASFLVSITYLKRCKSITLLKDNFKMEWKTMKMVMGYGISSFITQISITIVMGVTNNMLKLYGAQSIYGAEIPLTALGITMKVNQILISILVGIAVGSQPIIGYNYGAGNYKRVKKTYKIAIMLATGVTGVAFLIFQLMPQNIINLFGAEDALYNEFAVKCFKIFLMLCVANGFQTVSGIFLQAIGKPFKAAAVSLSRQIVFLVPAAILLPRFLGVEGVLWAGPLADTMAFMLAGLFMFIEMRALGNNTKGVENEQEGTKEDAFIQWAKEV
jgi:putative MATE family efflux protein